MKTYNGEKREGILRPRLSARYRTRLTRCMRFASLTKIATPIGQVTSHTPETI
jgi:hypothetical protein